MENFVAPRILVREFLQGLTDPIIGTHQQKIHPLVREGSPGPLQLHLGGVVSPHYVECNSKRTQQCSLVLSFVEVQDLPTVVISTFHADFVGMTGGTAVVAVRQGRFL